MCPAPGGTLRADAAVTREALGITADRFSVENLYHVTSQKGGGGRERNEEALRIMDFRS